MLYHLYLNFTLSSVLTFTDPERADTTDRTSRPRCWPRYWRWRRTCRLGVWAGGAGERREAAGWRKATGSAGGSGGEAREKASGNDLSAGRRRRSCQGCLTGVQRNEAMIGLYAAGVDVSSGHCILASLPEFQGGYCCMPTPIGLTCRRNPGSLR